MNVITLSTEENEARRLKNTQEDLHTIKSLAELDDNLDEDNDDLNVIGCEEVETNREITLPVLVRSMSKFHLCN